MVGAPRGQPLSEKQRTINEIGVIYKCFFNTSSCKQFVVDEWGNVDDERDPLKSEFKDHQWLGASMDGNSKDGQRFVVSVVNFVFQMCSVHLTLNIKCRSVHQE